MNEVTSGPRNDFWNVRHPEDGYTAQFVEDGGDSHKDDTGGIHFNAKDAVYLKPDAEGAPRVDITLELRKIACEKGNEDLHDCNEVDSRKPWERTRWVFEQLTNSPSDKFTHAKEEFKAYLDDLKAKGSLPGPLPTYEENQKKREAAEAEGEKNYKEKQDQIAKDPQFARSDDEDAALRTLPGMSDFLPPEAPSKPTESSASGQPKAEADPDAGIKAGIRELERQKAEGSGTADKEIQRLQEQLAQKRTERIEKERPYLKLSAEEEDALHPKAVEEQPKAESAKEKGTASNPKAVEDKPKDSDAGVQAIINTLEKQKAAGSKTADRDIQYFKGVLTGRKDEREAQEAHAGSPEEETASDPKTSADEPKARAESLEKERPNLKLSPEEQASLQAYDNFV